MCHKKQKVKVDEKKYKFFDKELDLIKKSSSLESQEINFHWIFVKSFQHKMFECVCPTTQEGKSCQN